MSHGISVILAQCLFIGCKGFLIICLFLLSPSGFFECSSACFLLLSLLLTSSDRFKCSPSGCSLDQCTKSEKCPCQEQKTSGCSSNERDESGISHEKYASREQPQEADPDKHETSSPSG